MNSEFPARRHNLRICGVARMADFSGSLQSSFWLLRARNWVFLARAGIPHSNSLRFGSLCGCRNSLTFRAEHLPLWGHSRWRVDLGFAAAKGTIQQMRHPPDYG